MCHAHADREPDAPPFVTSRRFHLSKWREGYGDWKLLFINQDKWFRATQKPLTDPILINLKLDPFERFIEARGYDEWAENRSWIFGQAGKVIPAFVTSFKDYPPSQKGMSLQIDRVSEAINSRAMSR